MPSFHIVSIVIAPCIVFLFSWWLTRRLCDQESALHLLDHPNERSLHDRPTPRTGGLAVLLSAGVGFGLILLSDVVTLKSVDMWIMGATAVLAAVSFCDDRWGLPPLLRLCIHVAAAIGVVVGGGLVLEAISVPFAGEIRIGWVALPVTVLFLVWMTDLYNFMDGMDGFAGGMTMLGFAVLAYFGWQSGNPFIFVTASVLSAGAAGFLFHNFPPARIFMGDVGSVPIGFLSGSLAVLGMRERSFDLWVPLVLFSPFVVDATMTLIRRTWKGERIWEAHRTHYYQRLVLAGWGHRRTVLVEYGLMLLCGALAVLYHGGTEWQQAGVLLAVAAVYGGVIVGVQLVERRVRS
ncbi:Glycosyl transferase, family 4, conserved region [Nitrospira moscoviensis]|uniref:Glycosyl transferase, family 4, conserved region n=1 Tax=Nitrospira moscoviensis TaxID=42253 RepID=A0A0K2GGZ0_NITMO|nr:Glycosyl transferase, family 4, conserved region [Nitrospira moscoviensis]